MDYFHADRRPVWRRSPGPDAFLRRAIPVHGLRPADLPGKPARHRDLPLGPRIETLSHGLPPAGPALDAGDANERRDWRIHAALAQRLITQARTLYVDEDLTNTVYADSTTIARPGLSAHFRTTKAAVDAHAARPAGQHSEFYPHLGWQAARRPCPRYALAGSRSHVVDRGYVDFARLYVLHQAGAFFVTACQVEHRCSSRLFGADGSLDRHHLRPDHLPGRLLHPSGSPNFCGASASRTPSPARRWSSSPTTSRFRPPSALYKSRWHGTPSPSGKPHLRTSTERVKTS